MFFDAFMGNSRVKNETDNLHVDVKKTEFPATVTP